VKVKSAHLSGTRLSPKSVPRTAFHQKCGQTLLKLVSHLDTPLSPPVAAAIPQFGRSGCDGYAGSCICISWQSIIARGFIPAAATGTRLHTMQACSLSIRFVASLSSGGLVVPRRSRVAHSLNSLAVSLGSRAEDDIGVIIACCFKHMAEFIAS